MTVRTMLAMLLLLAAGAVVQAQNPSTPSGADGSCVRSERFWVEAEYLLWWMRGDRVPPLVTTSPPGTPIEQAGVLGLPGTAVLFGGERTNGEVRSGGRITIGVWLDDEQDCGVEASFFMLETKADGFEQSSAGVPILSRPFFDALFEEQAAERVAFPGDLAGGVAVSDASSLLGAGLLLRKNLCCGGCCRLDALAGYRHLRMTDRIQVGEELTVIDPDNPAVPAGTAIGVHDAFSTENQFHGFDFGLSGELRRGPWSLTLLGKLAVGGNDQSLQIAGRTTVTVPGSAPVTSAGGLLALSSNSGEFNRSHFALVPEFGAKLGYQLSPSWRVSLGYSLIYWTDVLRAGDQIDLAINPELLPPPLPVTGPLRPAVPFQRTDLLVHGINFGIEFRY